MPFNFSVRRFPLQGTLRLDFVSDKYITSDLYQCEILQQRSNTTKIYGFSRDS